MRIEHPIPPVFNNRSKILILGSFPSIKSRETAFFYGHPQNRFWRVLSIILQSPLPQTTEQKIAFLHANHIALWDVIASCEIEGSSDSSIRNVVPNDLQTILNTAPIEKICVNGKTAEKYYIKYTEKAIAKKAILLPSTSPANAAWSIERLVQAWKQIFI